MQCVVLQSNYFNTSCVVTLTLVGSNHNALQLATKYQRLFMLIKPKFLHPLIKATIIIIKLMNDYIPKSKIWFSDEYYDDEEEFEFQWN